MATDYRYNRVSPKFWIDDKVIQWDDETRLLALYIMTCEHRTTEGLFRLPKAYIWADLGWTPERLAEPFAKLLADGFIRYDETVSVMLLTNALKWNPTDNPNQAKAAVKAVAELPKTPLLSDFQRLAERFDKRLAQQLAERFGKPQALTPTLTPTRQTDHARHLAPYPTEPDQEDEHPPESVGQSVDQPGDDDELPPPSDAMAWADVTQRYHRRLGMLGPSVFARLEFWHQEGLSAGAIVAGIEVTAQAKAEKRIRGHPDRYLDGVLRGMFNDGVRTVADIHERAGPQTEDEWVNAILAEVGLDERSVTA